MTEKTLNRANDLVNDIKWAEKLLRFSPANKLSFRIDIIGKSNDIISCPNWLRAAILEIVNAKKKEWQEELENL